MIIGYTLRDPGPRLLFDYETVRSAPHEVPARNINPYLVDAPDVLLPSRTKAPAGRPQLKKGSQPTDGGNLILTDAERLELVAREPGAKRWIKRFGGGEELLNGGWRWCLWLKGIKPGELRSMPTVAARVAAVKAARLKSPTAEVRQAALTPTVFTQDRQPSRRYLALPEVSSEARRVIPMRFLPPSIIASNKLQIVVSANLVHLGVLSSTMHMAWVRCVAGRLKSDYSYAPSVYNNFPWPTPTDAQRAKIEATAQGILDARAAHPGATLADLYDPLAMPPNLVAAHAANDRAVDAAYGQPRGFTTEAARLAFLFERYQALAAPLDVAPAPRRRPRRAG